MAEVALVKKLAKLIEENDEMPDVELAELLLETIDEYRGQKKRILVVGQIQYDGQEAIHTVALGPYSTVGKLDTYENWQARSEAHTASRNDGGKLAWDTSTNKGRGRFMVVPLLRTARDAWDFFRGTIRENEGEILEQAEAEWSIRGAPDDPDIGPVCICGLRESSGHSSVMGVPVKRGCPRCEVQGAAEAPEVQVTDDWDLGF